MAGEIVLLGLAALLLGKNQPSVEAPKEPEKAPDSGVPAGEVKGDPLGDLYAVAGTVVSAIPVVAGVVSKVSALGGSISTAVASKVAATSTSAATATAVTTTQIVSTAAYGSALVNASVILLPAAVIFAITQIAAALVRAKQLAPVVSYFDTARWFHDQEVELMRALLKSVDVKYREAEVPDTATETRFYLDGGAWTGAGGRIVIAPVDKVEASEWRQLQLLVRAIVLVQQEMALDWGSRFLSVRGRYDLDALGPRKPTETALYLPMVGGDTSKKVTKDGRDESLFGEVYRLRNGLDHQVAAFARTVGAIAICRACLEADPLIYFDAHQYARETFFHMTGGLGSGLSVKEDMLQIPIDDPRGYFWFPQPVSASRVKHMQISAHALRQGFLPQIRWAG